MILNNLIIRLRMFQFAACLLVLSSILPTAWAQKTQLTWYGQSAFKVTMLSGKVLLIDPWITNPTNPTGKADLAGLKHVDLILITHTHFDDVGDSVAIAKQSGAVKAVHPHLVFPMHFGTFPILTGTPAEFAKDLAALGVRTPMKVMQRHEPLSL